MNRALVLCHYDTHRNKLYTMAIFDSLPKRVSLGFKNRRDSLVENQQLARQSTPLTVEDEFYTLIISLRITMTGSRFLHTRRTTASASKTSSASTNPS